MDYEKLLYAIAKANGMPEGSQKEWVDTALSHLASPAPAAETPAS